jgi:hypothetical protein|tara:strand:- start:701 stop:856 length:156 start_codon:yes stop_codon:yes gene_type:complete
MVPSADASPPVRVDRKSFWRENGQSQRGIEILFSVSTLDRAPFQRTDELFL